MKRRVFLTLAAIGGAAAATYWCFTKPATTPEEALALPQFLGQVCDESEVVAIGKAYLKKSPADAGTLRKLLTGEAGGLDQFPTANGVWSMLFERVKEDFKADRTVILEGWVLSITEARQCALYSLTN